MRRQNNHNQSVLRQTRYLPMVSRSKVDAIAYPLMKLQRNGFDFILDRIYRIDGIFFASGEEPFRPKAVLS